MASCGSAAQSQNTVAGSRCQVVDDVPSQDQLADEMPASLYYTAQTRLRYYLRVRENMETKFCENYLVYIRKTKARKYSKCEKICFHYP